MTLPVISRLSRQRDRDLAHVLADDVVVGDDVAVGRDDDARAEAERAAIARAEHVVVVAEEVAEERIVRERRVRRAHDLQRRDVGDALDRLAGDAREVGAAGATPAPAPAPGRRLRALARRCGSAAGRWRRGGASNRRPCACRPVTTRPAAKPATTKHEREGVRRRIMRLDVS